MPKLPHIGGRECLATLRKMGFVEVRQKGSHVIMRKGQRGCVVPNHKEIRIGTLAGLLKQAGIDPDEFIEYLKK